MLYSGISIQTIIVIEPFEELLCLTVGVLCVFPTPARTVQIGAHGVYKTIQILSLLFIVPLFIFRSHPAQCKPLGGYCCGGRNKAVLFYSIIVWSGSWCSVLWRLVNPVEEIFSAALRYISLAQGSYRRVPIRTTLSTKDCF